MFKNYTVEQLDQMTVPELKKLARENGYTGTAIDFMTKAQIVTMMVTGKHPEMREAPTPTPPPTLTVASTSDNDLASALAGVLSSHLKLEAKVDQAQIEELVEKKLRESGGVLANLTNDVIAIIQNFTQKLDAFDAFRPNIVELKYDNKQKKLEGIHHKTFQRLLEIAMMNLNPAGPRMNVWLVGGAGTGKTTAAENVAKALDLPFYFNGAIDTEYKLRGFLDAHGRIVSTPFMQAYKTGGVYLFDEVDSSLPPALLAFNAALSNNHYDFPDGVTGRHEKFICIAAANTFGLGADSTYVGRLKQDAAFLDRFVHLHWPIDEHLERVLANNDAWVSIVQKVRKNIATHGMQLVVSPRASYFGAAMLAAGIPYDDVIQYCLKKGMSDDQWQRVKA